MSRHEILGTIGEILGFPDYHSIDNWVNSRVVDPFFLELEADFTLDGINIEHVSVRGRDVVNRVKEFVHLSVSLSLEHPFKANWDPAQHIAWFCYQVKRVEGRRARPSGWRNAHSADVRAWAADLIIVLDGLCEMSFGHYITYN
ncbi:hypothetical protein N0V85_001129 [Neurospora sp. IMI 360204]|nr:hypothetical protein N0V85_001129 [Neurospora sp. IMI 360204]